MEAIRDDRDDRDAKDDKTSLRVVDILRRYLWQARLSEQGYTAERLQQVLHVLRVVTSCGNGQLGSHLFSCEGCGRMLIGFNRCGNRHCPGCSYEHRRQWHDRIIEWNLACDYWHIVFTLPHESHPLIRLNMKFMYGLLLRSAADTLLQTIEKHVGCTPGMVLVLHSWGQRGRYHVHVHIILTGGGLSLDKQQWIRLPHDHPALNRDALSQAFQRCFLRRLMFALRGNRLQWPETLLAGQVLPPVDRESSPPEKKLPRRPLTADEEDFIAVLRSKRWVVDVQPPNRITQERQERPAQGTEDESSGSGAEGIVKYLAKYVSGAPIGSKRLISDDGHYVTFSYTDYRTGETKTEAIPGGEFVQRVALHIMPRRMQRVRYKGLYAAPGRDKNLALCRALIAGTELKACGESAAGKTSPAEDNAEEEGDEENTDSACTCRYCEGKLQFVARLKGNETVRVKQLAAAILSLLPAITADDLKQLVQQLCSGFLNLWQLAAPFEEVIPVRHQLSRLQLIALAALLHEYQSPIEGADEFDPILTSGIPPPYETVESVEGGVQGHVCGAF